LRKFIAHQPTHYVEQEIKMPPLPSSTPPIDPSLRIASVTLAVGDLARSVDFYERMLGLTVISRDDDDALLGPDREHPLLKLSRLADPRAASPHSTGLFHVALLHPTRADLAATVLRLAHNRWPIDGASDHGVSEALYLSDPDGLGLEIYVDRPRELWSRPANGQGVKMFTLPLDVDDLLAQAAEGPTSAVPDGTAVGHVHLKVSDVPRAVSFYRDALGFQEQASLPSAGFLSAGGYHHHVGVNSWHSQNGGPAPEDAPGLRLVEFELGSRDALAAVERRLGQSPGADSGEGDIQISLVDPDGTALRFSLGRQSR
jgi:catechol 2,3-dioxygenase